ncbi:MAG: undecaprenyl-diphospho-oligosaccharide flippase [Gemmatimonadota bacterium]|nr:MAG: undecaprenyl-diphospho-oligosaccharide flippase [Gemmatimonadota bacterium]
MSIYREIMKHSGVYGLGLILSRLASFLLLPLYTSYLVPADYGVLAILDLTTTIISHLAAGGLYAAVLREYHDKRFRDRRHLLWTTGLVMLAAISLPQLALVAAFRESIAALVFGASVVDGPSYLLLALAGLPAQLFIAFSQAYIRAQKRSTLFIGITIPALLVRIGLNVWLIAFEGMGVYGFLYSSLIAGALEALAMFLALFAGRPAGVIREAIPPIWRYGWPLMITSLAAVAMHQMDRYLLRWQLEDLGPIGVYSVAYMLAQGVNSLVITPFNQIWSTVIYEADQLPERLDIFRRVFRYFVLGISLVLLALALLAEPIVRIVTAPEYAEAGRVLPLLCLAMLFFPMHTLFRLPAVLHRRTVSVARTSLVAALSNLAANLALIPYLGIYGAAIASVVTYAVYAFFGHWTYRRIENIGFPIRYVLIAATGGAGLVLVQRAVAPADAPLVLQIGSALVLWLVAFGLVLAGPARELFRADSPLRRILANRGKKKAARGA